MFRGESQLRSNLEEKYLRIISMRTKGGKQPGTNCWQGALRAPWGAFLHARGFGFWSSLVSGWGTVTEESRWRIKVGLIASGLRTHLHLLRGDPPGPLAAPQLLRETWLSRAAIVWKWLMRLLWPSALIKKNKTAAPERWVLHIGLHWHNNPLW